MIKQYAQYLKEVHRMQDHMIPYYLKWVKNAKGAVHYQPQTVRFANPV